jgi:predicted transcriptional regulator
MESKHLPQKIIDQIYRLLDEGLSQPKISKRLKIGQGTVSNYKLVREQGLTSTQELVIQRAQNNGFKNAYDQLNSHFLEQGHKKGFADYKDALAVKKGHKNDSDYRNSIAREEGYRNATHKYRATRKLESRLS